jgi:hypothetical protein
MGDSEQHLQVLDTRADVHFRKTEYIEARQIHEQIVKRTSSTSSPFFHANSLCFRAYLDCLTSHEPADILENLNAAEAIYKSHGSQRFLLCSYVLAELKLCRTDTEGARSAFIDCLSKNRSAHYPDLPDFCLAPLADPKHRMHGIIETFRWAVVYLAFVQKKKDPVGTVNSLRCLADLHTILDGEDSETALNLFYAALDAGTMMDIHRLRAVHGWNRRHHDPAWRLDKSEGNVDDR